MRKLAYWFSLLMIFLIPWESMFELPGLGTASQLIGMVVLGIWAFSVIQRGGMYKLTIFHASVAIFFLWNLTSILWSFDQEASFDRGIAHLRLFGMMILIWDLYDSSPLMLHGFLAVVLGSFAPIIGVTINFVQQRAQSWGRYSAGNDNANTTGIIIALAVPFALYLATTPKSSFWHKLIGYIFIPAAIFGIALTATRFALLMIMPALLFGLGAVVQLKPAYRVVIWSLFVIGLFTLPFFIPSGSLQRLSTAGAEISGGDLNGRTEFWMYGLNMWIHKPLQGIGSNAFPSAVQTILGIPRSIHNSFLAILVETGVIGLILFVLLIVLGFAPLRQLPFWDALFWLSMLLVWALGNMAVVWVHTKATWLMLSFLAVAIRNYRATQSVELTNKNKVSYDYVQTSDSILARPL